jgi:hypothetical protein
VGEGRGTLCSDSSKPMPTRLPGSPVPTILPRAWIPQLRKEAVTGATIGREDATDAGSGALGGSGEAQTQPRLTSWPTVASVALRRIAPYVRGSSQIRPHDWRCPVTIKLDPDHVAWTCASCGAIATTDDPAVRPA